MAKLSYTDMPAGKLPKPVAPLKIDLFGSSAYISYAGATISLNGDFVGKANGDGATGFAYSVSISVPSGRFSADGVVIPIETIINAARSLDLTPIFEAASIGNDTVAYGPEVMFGGRGDDLLDEGYQGIFFGGPGIDTLKIHGASKHYAISQTELGTVVQAYWGTKKTLVGVEKVQFDDATITVSSASPHYDLVASAYGAVLRTDGSDFTFYEVGKAGTKEAAIAALLERSEDSTMPALIVYDAVRDKTPSSGDLSSLATFVKMQINSPGYQATANPRLGGYEAMGLGLAETIEFKAKFGAGTDGDVVRSSYQSFFGRAATEAQVQHFVGQIDYFEGLYLGAGIAADAAAIKARGAAIGQMLGYAAAEGGDVRTDAVTWLTAAANGNAQYGQPLDLM